MFQVIYKEVIFFIIFYLPVHIFITALGNVPFFKSFIYCLDLLKTSAFDNAINIFNEFIPTIIFCGYSLV